jgi:D-amino peptidase
MKYFISFDFEGIAGVTYWRETENDSRYEKLATEQLLQYMAGIKEADPQAEIVLCDSHNDGNNIHWEMMPEYVKLVRGYPRTYYMIEGLDISFDKLILFGYHSPIGGGGMMDHSYSSSSIFELKVNGQIMDEALINSYLASEIGVPTAFYYGDDKGVEFAKKHFPNAVFVVSKQAISRFAGVMLPPAEIYTKLRQAGQDTVKAEVKPIPITYPVDIEIQFTDSTRAYLAGIIPNVVTTSPRSTSYQAKDYNEFYRYLMTVTTMCATAKSIR